METLIKYAWCSARPLGLANFARFTGPKGPVLHLIRVSLFLKKRSKERDTINISALLVVSNQIAKFPLRHAASMGYILENG
jgi:hypothetical protein